MPLEIRVIGTAEAESTVAVHAQITGAITSVNFNEGDDVTEGQVLFTLDRRPLEATLQQVRGEPRARSRAGIEREDAGGTLPDAGGARARLGPGNADERDRGCGARGHRRSGSGGAREREGSARLRDVKAPISGPHGRAHRAPGQPRSRQRRRRRSSSSTASHQSTSRSASPRPAARIQALPRRAHAAGRGERARRKRCPRWATSRSSTMPSIRRPGRSRSRDRFPTPIGGSGRDSSSTSS